jgi:hypothetical protein
MSRGKDMKNKMSLLVGAASLALVSRKRTEGNRNTSAEPYITDWLEEYLMFARKDVRSWNVGLEDWSYADMKPSIDYLVETCFDERPQYLQSMTFEAFEPVFDKVFNTLILGQEGVAEYISIWLNNLLLNYQFTFEEMDPMLAQQLNDPIRMQELKKARAQSFKGGVLSFATMNRKLLVKQCYDEYGMWNSTTPPDLANFTAVFNKVLDQKILQEATQ